MSIQRREFVAVVGSATAVGLAGCTADGDGSGDGGNGDSGGGSQSEDEQPGVVGETLTLTTTTSTYDTGLLDELNVPFEDRYGVTVDAVAQGTGRGPGDRA